MCQQLASGQTEHQHQRNNRKRTTGKYVLAQTWHIIAGCSSASENDFRSRRMWPRIELTRQRGGHVCGRYVRSVKCTYVVHAVWLCVLCYVETDDKTHAHTSASRINIHQFSKMTRIISRVILTFTNNLSHFRCICRLFILIKIQAAALMIGHYSTVSTSGQNPKLFSMM